MFNNLVEKFMILLMGIVILATISFGIGEHVKYLKYLTTEQNYSSKTLLLKSCIENNLEIREDADRIWFSEIDKCLTEKEY